MTEIKRENFAREGRENQYYNGEYRVVAGGVILNDERTRVLLISSSSSKQRWILPKGGVEIDEADNFEKAALRECWEEAGADCMIVKKILDMKSDNSNGIMFTHYNFYEMRTKEVFSEWPEKHKRNRSWFTFEDAKTELLKSKRLESVAALNKSSIIKG